MIGSIVGGVAGVAGSVVKHGAGAIRSAVQANRANDLRRSQQDAKNGTSRSLLYKVGDIIDDAANVVGFGLPDRIENVFRKRENKLNYKALDSAKKERGDDAWSMNGKSQVSALLTDVPVKEKKSLKNLFKKDKESVVENQVNNLTVNGYDNTGDMEVVTDDQLGN